MSVQNFIPTIWSQKLILALRKNFVFRALVNQDYEGDIGEAGDTVKITRPSSLATKDYAGSVVYDDPASTQQQLVVDQKKYWAFKVDDVDKTFANTDLISTYTGEGGVSMGDAVDSYLAGFYTDAHANNIIAKEALTAANIYAKFVAAGENLDDQNVPRTGRWAVVSPAEYALLLQADEFIKASDLGDEVVQTGALGQVAGFRIHMSNNVVTANDGTNDVRHLPYGTNAAITFADELVQMEAMRLENKFGDGVRSLLVYGAKTIRPEALGDLRNTVA